MGRLERHAAHVLTRIGTRTPRRAVKGIGRALNLLETGRRLRQRGFELPAPVHHRSDVFTPAIEAARAAQQPLYLEFGVYEGETLAEWSRRLDVPGAKLFGFDSFEGLPEAWNDVMAAGHFSTDGRLPAIDDNRVSLVKGWFDDTVPGFEAPPHDLLVANVDCDLYSSAVTVLDWVRDNLRVGDFLYFDEFYDRLHEGRAFHEFVDRTGFEFRVVAGTHGMMQVLFRREA